MQALQLRIWAATTGPSLPPPVRGGAVGEADCDWAGEQPTRSCYFRGEELRAGIYCEPPNRLGPLPVVFEAPVYGVPGLCKLSDHTGGMGDLLLVIEGSLGSSSV